MHKVRGSYSSCTYRSSENICSNGGGANEKGKRASKPDEKTQFGTKKWCISEFHTFPPPLRQCIFLNRFIFLNHHYNLESYWVGVISICTYFIIYIIPPTIQTWNYRLHAIICVVVVADGPALNPRALTNYEIWFFHIIFELYKVRSTYTFCCTFRLQYLQEHC